MQVTAPAFATSHADVFVIAHDAASYAHVRTLTRKLLDDMLIPCGFRAKTGKKDKADPYRHSWV